MFSKTILFLSLSLFLEAYEKESLVKFNAFKNGLNHKYDKINKGIKRNVYTILDSYDSNPQAILLKKWFKIASQVTYNDSLSIFIHKTDIKVKALTTQLMFVENNAISDTDRKILKSKFKFLYQFSKNEKPINKILYINVKDEHGKSGLLFIRTMPILDVLTKKKYSDGKYITLADKSMVRLLHNIHFKIDNQDSYWGYVESPADGLLGWINLKYTKEHR